MRDTSATIFNQNDHCYCRTSLLAGAAMKLTIGVTDWRNVHHVCEKSQCAILLTASMHGDCDNE